MWEHLESEIAAAGGCWNEWHACKRVIVWVVGTSGYRRREANSVRNVSESSPLGSCSYARSAGASRLLPTSAPRAARSLEESRLMARSTRYSLRWLHWSRRACGVIATPHSRVSSCMHACNFALRREEWRRRRRGTGFRALAVVSYTVSTYTVGAFGSMASRSLTTR